MEDHQSQWEMTCLMLLKKKKRWLAENNFLYFLVTLEEKTLLQDMGLHEDMSANANVYL